MSVRRLFLISRPAGYIAAIFLFLVGIKLSNASFGFVELFQMLMLTLPLSLLIFGINDVYDYKSDALNPRKKRLMGVKLLEKEIPYVKKAIIILLIPLVISSLITLNLWNIISMLLLIFLSYAYSAPPLRLKEIPLVESISNALIIYLMVMLGFTFNARPWELTHKAYWLMLMVVAYHLFTTIMDYESDKKAGHKTFAVRFGKRAAAAVAFISGIISSYFGNYSSIEFNFLSYVLTFGFGVTMVFPRFAKICFICSAPAIIISVLIFIL